MPQSLSKIYIHVVFSTKNGKKTINKNIRNELHCYTIGILSKIGSYTNELYANPDHIHILFTLPRTITMAMLISKIKTSTSKWLKQNGVPDFQWQDGYAVFSVSSSKVSVVENYIKTQEIHHSKTTFKDELRIFLNEYKIDFDEKYLWD